MAQTFRRNIEDFTCEHCGAGVKGNGYTNHCPKCLWSKHVDVHPGDRAAECGGMMEPVGVHIQGGEHDIVHQCVKCGHRKYNKVEEGDDRDVFIALSQKPVGDKIH